MMKTVQLLGLCALLAASACASAQEKKTCFHLHAAEKDIGYCQAVRVGNTLHISGTPGEGPMPDAIKNVYGTLKKTLDAHGLTFAHVVRETVYATDLDAFIKHKALRKAMYGDSFPAASWVQVQRLYLPSMVLEVELTAEFPALAKP